MRLVLVRGQEDELLNPMVLPFRQQFVQSPVKCFPLDACGPGIGLLPRVPDTIFETWCQENPGPSGYFLSHPLDDEGIGAQREMGPVLNEGTNGENEARIGGQDPSYFGPRQVAKGP